MHHILNIGIPAVYHIENNKEKMALSDMLDNAIYSKSEKTCLFAVFVVFVF